MVSGKIDAPNILSLIHFNIPPRRFRSHDLLHVRIMVCQNQYPGCQYRSGITFFWNFVKKSH